MAVEDTEFGNLIGSDKVEGTAVYGADGEKIGSIERVMLDKRSGQVSYAVLAFGGFLGMGSEHYPLSWSTLKYNTELGGYQVGLTEDQLNGAPKYAAEDEWDWDDPERVRAVDAYYGPQGAPGILPQM
ncbi:MAG: PRC-barrel domain-containing protein [Bradyrhizobium sp.]